MVQTIKQAQNNIGGLSNAGKMPAPVSYTHLTLPTSDLV